MERGGARGPVPRTLCTPDGPPGEGGTAQPVLARIVPRLVENQVAPAQDVGGGVRLGQREHGQDEDFRVPEGMAVVAGARQPFRRDGSALPTCSSLQDVEECKAHRLLDLRVAIELDVRPGPEVVQVGTLLGQQALPATKSRGGQRGYDLVMDGRPRTQARPAVGNEFDDAQPLAWHQPSGDGHTGDIGGAIRLDDHSGGSLDVVIHCRPDAQTTDPRVMDHEPEGAPREMLLALKRGRESGTHPGILALVRERLIGDQLRLHNDTYRGVNRLDLVADGRDSPLGERHHAH